MEVHFIDRDSQMSDEDKALAVRKVQRISRFLKNIREAHITHREQRGIHSIEVCVDANGVLLRAEERDNSLRTAIDQACEKVERRVRRFKGRLLDRWHEAAPEPAAEAAEVEEEEAGELPDIIRTKRFLLKPMKADEAALQMELLHHDFFAFLDADRNEFSVVYRRKDGNYTVLELER